MSKNLEKKLLAEALDALVNDNDIAKATRLMRRHLDLVAQSQYQLLESEDEDFEVTDMGDDFNSEVAAEAGSSEDEKFDDIQIAIDELEDKFPAEMSEDVESKFDELRNIVDELKLADEGDEVSVDDALVVLEDLRADFEMAGDLSDEVSDLFDEVTSGLQGDSAMEEIEADDDSEFEDEEDDSEEVDVDDDLEEGCSKKLKEADDTDVDLAMEDEESEKPAIEDETDAELDADVEEEPAEGDDEELIFDIKSDAEELLAKIEELEAGEKEEEPAIEEGFEKVADPRKKMSSEGEGVEKKRTMNFGKLSGMTLKKGSDLLNGKASKGTEPSKKAPVKDGYENKGAKSWHKVEKPANKPAAGKSMMGN